MLHISTTNLILVGVFAHLLLSLSKLVFKSPKQQAQITAIDAKVDRAVQTVQKILPVVQTINSKTFTSPAAALAAGEEFSQALLPLPTSKAASGGA